MDNNSIYDTDEKGTIVVIGASEVKESTLKAVIKPLNLDDKRFEFCLKYKDIKKYPFEKLRYNPKYRVVIYGPVPHSSTGKSKSSSALSEMKNNVVYPRVVSLSSNNAIKITKCNFTDALKKLIEENYI